MTKNTYGVIDIGSNTIRFVIYHINQSGRFKVIQNVKIVARLRNYLDENNVLTDEGMHVLLNAMKSFQDVEEHFTLDEVICVATATLRQAVNQKDIIEKIERETSFSPRILSGYEEAYYGFLAVIRSLEIKDGITIDIGGGSTEITYFKNHSLKKYHSFPFGALSLRHEFVKGDVPTETELATIKEFVHAHFESLPWLKNKKLPIIAIGGSARNVVQIDQAKKHYPLSGIHQYKLKAEDIVKVKNDLLGLTLDDLKKVDGLSSDRSDTILPALEVFDVLCQYTDANQFILSRKGLREGVLYEKLKPILPSEASVIEKSFKELSVDYEVDTPYVFQVMETVEKLFNEMLPFTKGKVDQEDIHLLKKATYVYDIGQYIDTEASSQHTFYLLANRTIDGLMHKERLMIALIASYKNKALFKQYIHPFRQWFSKKEKKKIRWLGAMLKISFCLNITKRDIIRDIRVEQKEDRIKLIFTCVQPFEPEEYATKKQVKHLEKVTKFPVDISFVPA